MAKPTAIHPLPRGCAWPSLAIGVLLALLGLGSLLGLPRCWIRSREMWTEAPGTIAESYLKEGQRRLHGGTTSNARSSEPTWDVRLKYRYYVDDHAFTGEAKALRQPKNDNRWDEAKAVKESYRVEDALPVFYKPADPSISRLTQKEPGIEFGKDVFVTLVFLSCGAAALYLARAILRRKPQSTPS